MKYVFDEYEIMLEELNKSENTVVNKNEQIERV